MGPLSCAVRASCSRLPAAIREATLAPGAAAKAGAHGATPALGTGLQATPAAGPGTSSIRALAGPTATAGASHPPVPLAVTFAQLQPGWALWGHFALAASRWLLVAPVPAGRGAGAGNGLERGQRDRLYRGAESQAGTNRRRGRREGPLLSLVRRQRWQGAAVPRSYLGRGGACSQGPPQTASPAGAAQLSRSLCGGAGSAGGVQRLRRTGQPAVLGKRHGGWDPLASHGWTQVSPQAGKSPSPRRSTRLSRQRRALTHHTGQAERAGVQRRGGALA